MTNKTIIAVIGIPGSGKTSFANKLSTELFGIPVINTDLIKAIYEAENEYILSKVSHSAWELVGECSKENIIKGYDIFSKTLFQYAYSLAKKLLNTYTVVIIEGMGINLPDLSEVNENTICVLFTNQNKEKSYSDKLKFRANKINNWVQKKEILEEIENYLFDNYVKIQKSAFFEISDAEKAMKFIKEHLSEEIEW